MTVSDRRQLSSPVRSLIDPQRPFKFTNANVGIRIAMLTLPTKRLLCAAVIGSLVCFLGHKQPWEGSLDGVAD